MIRIVWSIISSLKNSDSITYYIPTILKFALGSKISYTDEYLSSESETITAIFLIQKLCKVFFTFSRFSCDGGIFTLARLLI